MASYFRWMKQQYLQEEGPGDMIYGKPRSRSLDAKALAQSGVRHPLVLVGNAQLKTVLLGTRWSHKPVFEGTNAMLWLEQF